MTMGPAMPSAKLKGSHPNGFANRGHPWEILLHQREADHRRTDRRAVVIELDH